MDSWLNDRSKVEGAIGGAVRSAMHAHGTFTDQTEIPAFAASIAKRVYGTLKQLRRDSLISPDPTTQVGGPSVKTRTPVDIAEATISAHEQAQALFPALFGSRGPDIMRDQVKLAREYLALVTAATNVLGILEEVTHGSREAFAAIHQFQAELSKNGDLSAGS